MSRRSSPRPTFAAPTRIAHGDATMHLWGDTVAGYVGDRIYLSTDKIHLIELTLPPRGRFAHSDDNRTVFAADEVYHVLEGELLLANPETGEAELVHAGESVFFRRDTWHHGFNRSTNGPMRALELFAPPPSTGASSAYARTRANLTDWRYADDRWLGRWPMARAERDLERSFWVIRPPNLLWRMEADDEDALIGLIASTEHLTAGRARLLPGQRSGVRCHPSGDLALVVLEGTLNVFLPDAVAEPSWSELRPGDAFYVPAGSRYQWFNAGAVPLELLFGIAPGDLPGS
jgi:mannose-6-phosphate isomerase-like protein (cupin superfamily)